MTVGGRRTCKSETY